MKIVFVLLETINEGVASLKFDLIALRNDLVALFLIPLTLYFIVFMMIAFPIYYVFRALYSFILFFGNIFDYQEHRIINKAIYSLEYKCVGRGVPISRRPNNHVFCYSCWKLWSQ